MNAKEEFKRLLFWVCWCCLLIIGLLIIGIALLNPFWTVAFTAVWILFGIVVYWVDTAKEIDDENMNL